MPAFFLKESLHMRQEPIMYNKNTKSTTLPALIPWFIASFYTFFQFLGQTTAGIMGAEWMRDFHLDKVGLSNLSAAFFYTYALMQIPAGILFDRYSARYILTAAALALAAGCFLLSYTENYQVAIVARLLMGIGSSYGFVGLLQISAIWFPPNRFAMMIGLSECLTMLGVTFGVVFLTWLVTHWSWRSAMFGGGVITFITMIVTFLFVRDQPDRHLTHERQLLSIKIIAQRLKIIFTDRQVILGSLFGFFIFSIVNAFTSLWGISFLTHAYPFSQQLAANMVAMIFIGIAIGGALCGWLSKIVNQQRGIVLAGGGCAAFTMSVIIFCPHLPPFLLFILFLLIGLFCSVYVLSFSIVKDSVNPAIRATALATTNMVIMLGAPILQLLIGFLLQSHFFGLTDDTGIIYRLSLGILPIGMFAAFVLAFWIKEPSY